MIALWRGKIMMLHTPESGGMTLPLAVGNMGQ